MPYREKYAWLNLIGIAIPYAAYFAVISAWSPSDDMPGFQLLKTFAIAATAHAAIVLGGLLYLRTRFAADARIPPDERDQIILRRGMSAAYWVLITGMIVVGVVMPFTVHGWRIVNGALAAIVLAEIVHHGVVVGGYRRQS